MSPVNGETRGNPPDYPQLRQKVLRRDDCLSNKHTDQISGKNLSWCRLFTVRHSENDIQRHNIRIKIT